MKPVTYNMLLKVPVGTYFATYSYVKAYTGKNLWICKVTRYGSDKRVEVIKTIFSGYDMWDSHMNVCESNGRPDVINLSNIKSKSWDEVFIFEKEDYYNFIMSDI